MCICTWIDLLLSGLIWNNYQEFLCFVPLLFTGQMKYLVAVFTVVVKQGDAGKALKVSGIPWHLSFPIP